MNYKKIIVFSFCILISIFVFGQQNHTEKYIEKYKNMAIREMKRTGIPASITLAQGILESGSGRSRLSTKGNNHFGIKCHNWSGREIYEDDDRRNECFRKYRSAEQSFRDHSDFLTGKQRYASLFRIPKSNYKAWAKGLKRAGYATAWDYDKRLIGLIKRYNLAQYDNGRIRTNRRPQSTSSNTQRRRHFTTANIKHRVRYRNKVPYFIVTAEDSFNRIARETGVERRKILKYNDMSPSSTMPRIGSPLYLKKKKRRTPSKYRIHIANGRETIHDISQRYAIRMSILLKNNGIKDNETPYEGQQVLLR